MSLIGPVFLPELEREIFEITGWLHRTRIPTLLRVARRVYIWLRPVLYRVLRLSNRSLSALIPAMEREPNFLRDVVRFICWDRDNVLTTEQTRLLLTICSGVEDLVLEHSYHEPNRLGLALSRLVAEYENLRRFTSSSMEFMLISKTMVPGSPGGGRRLALFPWLTHLELTGPFHPNEHDLWPQVSRISSLTHLACSGDDGSPWNQVQTLLDSLSNLRTFIFIYGENEVRRQFPRVNESAASIRDIRFMAGSFPDSDDDVWAEWEQSAKGLTSDYWDRGERFLERKKRGEVAVTRIWMEDWLYDDSGGTQHT